MIPEQARDTYPQHLKRGSLFRWHPSRFTVRDATRLRWVQVVATERNIPRPDLIWVEYMFEGEDGDMHTTGRWFYDTDLLQIGI